MGLHLAILLAIDDNLIILGRTGVRLGHEPSTLCILALGGGQDIGQMTRVSGAFLFAKESKEHSTGFFIKLRSGISLVLVRIWQDLNGFFDLVQ